MATYSDLVTLINAYINENGVQAITGRILNGVLNEMVDQLGSGFPIMGSAVPTDNPGTPDSPRAWFASEPGTYTNFGGIVIEEGELALLIYDNGWNKADIGQGGDPNAVQYIEQELTDEEQAQARENIGACSAEDAPGSAEPSGDTSVKYTVQNLTSAQKAQARTNIGAGTSSFSGRYEDLQDKPQQVSLSQNIVADKSATGKAYSCKATYDDVHPAMAYAQPVGGMLPNVFYDLGVLDGGNVTFSLAAPLDASVVNHYFFVFRTGETAPNVTWPSNIIGWINGGDPELEPMTHYEISIINGYAAFLYI